MDQNNKKIKIEDDILFDKPNGHRLSETDDIINNNKSTFLSDTIHSNVEYFTIDKNNPNQDLNYSFTQNLNIESYDNNKEIKYEVKEKSDNNILLQSDHIEQIDVKIKSTPNSNQKKKSDFKDKNGHKSSKLTNKSLNNENNITFQNINQSSGGNSDAMFSLESEEFNGGHENYSKKFQNKTLKFLSKSFDNIKNKKHYKMIGKQYSLKIKSKNNETLNTSNVHKKIKKQTLNPNELMSNFESFSGDRRNSNFKNQKFVPQVNNVIYGKDKNLKNKSGNFENEFTLLSQQFNQNNTKEINRKNIQNTAIVKFVQSTRKNNDDKKDSNQKSYQQDSIQTSKNQIFDQQNELKFQREKDSFSSSRIISLIQKIYKQDYLIKKMSNFYRIWNFLLVILMILLFIFVPLQLSEPKFDNFFVIKLFDDVIFQVFLFDILVNFNTAQEDSNGKYNQDRKLIIFEQARTWFIVDLASTLDFSFIFNRLGSNNHDADDIFVSNSIQVKLLKLKVFKQFRFFRSIKLFKLVNIKSISEISYQLETKQSTIIQQFLFLLIQFHFFACVYVQIARAGFNENNPEFNTWYNKYLGKSKEELLISDFEGNKLYVIGWYLGIQTATTVGQGDIGDFNNQERLFKIMGMLVGIYVWSFFSAELISISVDEDIANFPDHTLESLANRIINQQDIDESGVEIINNCITNQVEYEQISEYQFLMDNMDYKSRMDVFADIMDQFTKRVYLLSDISIECFLALYPNMSLIQFENETSLDQSEETFQDDLLHKQNDRMFFLQRGMIGQQDFVLDKYHWTKGGIQQMVEYGRCFNLDKILFKQQVNYSKEFLIYANTEILTLKMEIQIKSAKQFYGEGQSKMIKNQQDRAKMLLQDQYQNKNIIQAVLYFNYHAQNQINQMNIYDQEIKHDIEKNFINYLMTHIKNNKFLMDSSSKKKDRKKRKKHLEDIPVDKEWQDEQLDPDIVNQTKLQTKQKVSKIWRKQEEKNSITRSQSVIGGNSNGRKNLNSLSISNFYGKNQ